MEILKEIKIFYGFNQPDIFDDDNNGEVDFKEFIQGLSHFSAKGDMESKLRFAFRLRKKYVFFLITNMDRNHLLMISL